MGSPLRVLHVVVNMNRGGAETLIMNLYRNIDRTKVQFDFLTCKEGVFDSEILEMGGKIHRISYVTEVGHSGYVEELDMFFKEHSYYQVVHSHLDKMSGLVLRAARKADIPVRIAHSHNTQSEGGAGAKVYKWLVGQQIKRSATHLFACSNAASKWLFGNQADKAQLIKNGIEFDKFQFSFYIRNQVRAELQLNKDTLVLGHVGRFCEQKNHMFLLETFAEIHKKIPDSKLVLVGDGPLKGKINDKIRSLHLQQAVMVLGVREDIPYLLQAFDTFMFPSFHEGLPVTLIEAQGAGLPCYISETITDEVDMGNELVRFLPITNKSVWVEQIVNEKHTQTARNVSHTALTLKGYDIRKTAEDTEKSYIMLGGRTG
ncbi:glycosyltransferase [Rossellomorea vietnamensis]|uniref:Glycosyltransferase n=1 Tax=Rossellomorea vietnamensis TaxID=218284 RepID=A0A6I6UNN8_9BACI|nr:glycosyltransferase family 1 protein [Rossellomorea vietnamensis]QHE59826.1 glycosyltransferase [Rossellomorea vietnamensis]